MIQYASGDGNDTIFGFNSDDTLQITSGTYTTKNKGNDVIVTVGKGKIRLKDAKGTDINIVTAETNSQTAELFAENNFAAADNISEIVPEKSIGEFEFMSS